MTRAPEREFGAAEWHRTRPGAALRLWEPGMTAVAHTERKHSRIGPSAAHRWMHCPGSVLMSAHVPNKSTYYTREGTAAHEFVEHVMVTGVAPSRYVGGRVILNAKTPGEKFLRADDFNPAPDDEAVWEITDEMVEASVLYRDTLKGYISDGDIVEFETRLDMTFVHPDLFGTGDALIYNHRTKHLIVGDFKYGRGVAVDARDNEQLLTYAVGAAHRFREFGVKKVTTVIIQPRAYHHDGPVRSAEVDDLDLAIFEAHLREKAAQTDDPLADTCAGEQCRFCPVAHECDTLRKYVYDSTGLRFLDRYDPIGESELPDPNRMSADQLGTVFRNARIIEGWLRRVMEHAHDRAMAGDVPTGTKIVDKRAYRKFTDADTIRTLLELEGFDEEDFMRQPQLQGITAIESLLGKKQFGKLLGPYTKKTSSGYVLADENDSRPAAKLTDGGEFGAAED